MNVVFEGKRPKGSIGRRLLRWALFFGSVGTLTAGLVTLVAWAIFSKDVPDFSSLEDYRPKLVTRVFDQSGQLIGEFYRERRILLPYDHIPPKLVQAFLASEDDRFFQHQGIDYFGLIRAAVKNLRARRVVQGGSTITQQVAKSLLISAEGYSQGKAKKFSRKIKEAILARRLEKKLTKEEILTIYLNQIFLGNQAYGVEAAAENYFRKSVNQLNVAEMALLGGLPQAPSRYSPFMHPQAAKDRREYVLRRMLEEHYITQAELDEAKETPITVYPARDISREVTPFFTEQVRRMLVDKYGDKKVLDEGLEVYTTVDVERYRAAEDSAYDNLRLVDKRQGYRGALLTLETKAERETFLRSYSEELQRLDRYAKLIDNELYVGLITKIDHKNKLIQLKIGPHDAILPLATMRWARKVDPNSWFERALLEDIPKTFKVGDVIQVRLTNAERIQKDRYASSFLKYVPEDKTQKLVALEQEPDLETALLSVQERSGYVLAMIGGYSFDRSEFNRALQACRQPGSGFKPIVYSCAIDPSRCHNVKANAAFPCPATASTIVLDAPLGNDPRTFDETTGKHYKPQNFETKFVGEVTLRTALQQSMNVPAIKVLDGVGIQTAIDWAHKLGITTELRPELGMVLGSSCVTMGDLVDVYTLFSNYGARVKRKFIIRILDRDGGVLEDDGWWGDPWSGVDLKIARAVKEKPPEQVINRDTGYLITKMMRNVVQGGTGTPAQKLGVPVAGKTGTTNDSFDAWFNGFTTEIVTSAWVGYDDYVYPMGKYEQGGRAALPIWLGYMQKAIKSKKTPEFEPTDGVVFVHIDPKTGNRAREDTVGAVSEAYRMGTEPKEFVAHAGEAEKNQFNLVDQ
jgi:penicillin-binding protein 1A